MSGNLKIIDSKGATARDTQPTFHQILVKRFDKDEAKKLLGLCNKELNDIGNSWTVNICELGPSVEISCDSSKKSECGRDVMKLEECIQKLKCEVIDCNNQRKSRGEILDILKKQVGVVCIPSESREDLLRIFAINQDKLDQVKEKLCGSGDSKDNKPNSRRNRQFSYPIYDSSDPDSATGGTPTGRSYDYPYNDQNKTSGGRTGSPPDVKYTFQTKNGLIVKLYKGAITKLNVDSVVNAANEHLANGAGVAGALSKAGGYRFDRECRQVIDKNGNIPVTKNVVTGAGDMRYDGVIHAVGPQWYSFKNKTECIENVRDTVIEILETSVKFGYRSVAMPPISSGIFGVPTDLCAAMYVLGIVKFSETVRHLGRLEEFHIIDLKDEILDMVIDYYEKWKRESSVLDPYKLASRHPKVTKGDYSGHDWQDQRGWQGHRHNQGHSQSQGHGGSQRYGQNHDQDRSNRKDWNSSQRHHQSPDRFGQQGHNKGQGNDFTKAKPNHKRPSPCTFDKDSFVFRRKLRVHIYSDNILKCDVDAIVATDGREHRGAISKAIEKEEGLSLSGVWRDFKSFVHPHQLGHVHMVKPNNMKHLRCIYYIVMERFSPSVPPSSNQLKELKRVVLEVLGQANILPTMTGKRKKKKYHQLTRMAMSIPGAGALETPLYVEYVSEVMFDAFEEFTRKNQQMQLQEIHVVDMRKEVIVDVMRKTFHKKLRSFEQRPLPPSPRHSVNPKSNEFASGFYENDKDIGPMRKAHTPNFWPEKYHKIDKWRSNNKSSSGKLDIEQFFNKVKKSAGNMKIIDGSSGASKGGSMRSGATCGEQDEDSCVICMDSFDDPVKLNRCGHMFCKDCISESFHQKPVCPVCTTVYTAVQGDQPIDGTATVYRDVDASLPGYSGCKTLIINYIFPDGIQEEGHPDPGQRFRGLNRQAYLPDDPQGRKVLQMLKEAFEQRLIFTVGQSRTTGENNVVTWNDIHHKTRREGGPDKYGYPDKDYLDRVTEELKAKGIGL